jgi:hypothetical protein
MKMSKRKKPAVSSSEIAKGARTVKENVIIEASLKQLDTKHLTKLIVSMMREKLQGQDPEQFERNYQNALNIRKSDPKLFNTSPSGATFPLELLWADRKNGLCSEQEKNLVFVDPRPRSQSLSTQPALQHNWKSEASN